MRVPCSVSAGLLFVAWTMFVVSFFLPATNVLEFAGTPPGTPLTGWQAFRSSIEVPGAQPIMIFVVPRTLLFLVFPFINLAMLVGPLIARALNTNAWILSGVFLIAGLLPWAIPKELTGDLFVSFYLWDASFFAMSAACLLESIRARHFDMTDVKLTQSKDG